MLRRAGIKRNNWAQTVTHRLAGARGASQDLTSNLLKELLEKVSVIPAMMD